MKKKNVFVVGYDDFNVSMLESIPEAEDYNFISLLSFHEIRDGDGKPIESLLKKAVSRIESFDGSVDAIIGYWDYPVTLLASILTEKYGLPGVPVESILKCEHKYLSRLEQAKVIPEHIPLFEVFDPFNDNYMSDVKMLPPYWIKPIKSFSSYLAYRINSDLDFIDAREEIRRYIGKVTEPFEDFIHKYNLPEELTKNKGKTCIAESLLSGSLCTLEGYVYNNEVFIYGVIDSVRETDSSSFSRYEYPSKIPLEIQGEMEEITRKIMKHIGYDNNTFNIEFFYNQTSGKTTLLEINPRHSQSHAFLFDSVDGVANHKIQLDLALGKKPELPEKFSGKYRKAAKFMTRTFEDGFITKVPSYRELKKINKENKDIIIKLLATEGTRLSQMSYQDSYSYELADIYIPAQDENDLIEKYNKVISEIDFKRAFENDISIV
ncbi:MAG TPA: D-alanine--D-alanine ligase [Flexistipes sinusarabici]|uniref:D-alanine--D-alanine ligase n=1 Tax=Flexistipes sinusarabici TaxID=2352 RepID=A0A3D5Q956_FLESI|nr:D-alanine--D-alanine ligase [Flexistipes sinusarabici]